MSQRVEADSITRKTQFPFNSGSFVTARDKERTPEYARQEGRILPGYLDDQTLVLTDCLPQDTCPRRRFCRLNDPQVTARKNALVDSYYPFVECDCSEDCESQKNYRFYKNLRNLHKSANDSFDSRTFTIYSCKSDGSSDPKTDNPRPEGESVESGLECFSQLHKRIENLEEKLRETLENSIPNGDKKQKQFKSAHKLFQTVSELLESNKESEESFRSNNSDTENELRSIKKRLDHLEKKLLKEKSSPLREYLKSSTSNTTVLKKSVGEKSSEVSGIVFKESEFTEPLYSDTDSYLPKVYKFKIKKRNDEEKAQEAKVKQTFLSKCKILKRRKNKETPEYQKERFVKGLGTQMVNLVQLKLSNDRILERDWKRKLKKKRKNLCKKNSKTNIFVEENRKVKEAPTKEKSINSFVVRNSKDLGHCTSVENPDFNNSLPSVADNFFPPHCKDSKTTGLKLQKPLDFLKCEKGLKLPVLFEEILGKPKSLSANGKTSDMTMRFVLIHSKKDPLASLKKLVKKLSQAHSTKGKNR